MVEVRKFCFCTSNITCCKILGGIGLALVIINMSLWIIAVIGVAGAGGFHPILILPLINYLMSLTANLCLVFGAVKKNKTLLYVWFGFATLAFCYNTDDFPLEEYLFVFIQGATRSSRVVVLLALLAMNHLADNIEVSLQLLTNV